MNHFMINENVEHKKQILIETIARNIVKQKLDPHEFILDYIKNQKEFKEGNFMNALSAGWQGLKQAWGGAKNQMVGPPAQFSNAISAVQKLMQQIGQNDPNNARLLQGMLSRLQTMSSQQGNQNPGNQNGGGQQQQSQVPTQPAQGPADLTAQVPQGQQQQPQQPPQQQQPQLPQGYQKPQGFDNWNPQMQQQAIDGYNQQQAEIAQKKKSANLISHTTYSGPQLIEHCLKLAGVKKMTH